MPNYLYNGVELPELPEWDKTKFPYAFIRYNAAGQYYSLYCTSNKTNASSVNVLVYAPYCIYRAIDGVWVYQNEYTIDNEIPIANIINVLIWTNTDITSKFDDNDILLAASDPVPVGGEPEQPEEPETPTLTNRDLYRTINGKPVKLTLYKKVGGELIPLDEHTKEVKI